MVLHGVARGAEPDVLLVRVCEQEQLQPPDQPGQLCQPRPPPLLQIHRNGKMVVSDSYLPIW